MSSSSVMLQQPSACNFYDILRETILRVNTFREDESISRDEILDEMEQRLGLIFKKLISVPTATSYRMFR